MTLFSPMQGTDLHSLMGLISGGTSKFQSSGRESLVQESKNSSVSVGLKEYFTSVKDLSTLQSTKISHVLRTAGPNATASKARNKKELTPHVLVIAHLDLNSAHSGKLAKNLL